jgi:glycosyltransferase involved in cell wall biosynthesis
MKVCHIASGDRWAGAEVQLATLLRALRQIKDVDVSAILLNEGRLADEARKSGIEVCVIPESKQNFLQILSAATRFLRGRNIQVLHSHRYKESLLAAITAKRCGVPVQVSSRHGAPEPFAGWRRYKQQITNGIERLVERYSTDSVISVSEDLRIQLTRHLPASKVVTIYNGIDPEKVRSSLSISEAKQRMGIPVECRVIGTAGRLDPIKRLDLFLAAARAIASTQPKVRFVIAGEGKEESRLRGVASSLGISDRVLFLGHRDDVYDVLRAMDTFVLCSDHEGLPMALLETLYLGVPVVARPVGGICEVIEDGVNGVLIPSAEPSVLARACVDLLADESRRRSLGMAGSLLVRDKFSVTRTADTLTSLYRILIGAR